MADLYKTIPELFHFIRDKSVRPDLLNYRRDNSWVNISSAEFVEETEKLAAGLCLLGVQSGDHIGIIAPSSPFWVMADIAISLSGGITVPIFNRISPENLEFEIKDADIKIMIIGDEKEFEPVRVNGKKIEKIITIGFKKDDPAAMTFEDLLKTGYASFSRKFLNPGQNDLFTIIYTSGSMGVPKGVMLSHCNIISQVRAASDVFSLDSECDRAISTLPLAHIFERMVIYFYLSKGLPVYFADDLNKIGELMREVKPTVMTVVPRLLERVYEKMKNAVIESRGLKRVIGLAAFERAETRNPEKSTINLLDTVYKKLVYSKLYDAMGGSFRFVISGAAALPLEIGCFFNNIGITIYEGYGLTEASPVIAANSLENHRLGTVGLPLPSVKVKIAQDGEILAGGPNIMMGYLNNIKETEAAIDGDGFLHTGDLGMIDNDGYLKITGRKKELFKKSTGEYVPPLPIESALKKLSIVDTAVVIADKRKFVSCLIFPNFNNVNKLKDESGFSEFSTDAFLDSDFVRDMIQNFISKMNSHLHHTEEVQKFTIIKASLSIETGELTPTLKIRREAIEKKFKKEIDAMYSV